MSIKVMEIKNEDWSKGISAQDNIPVGGLFQRLEGIDPFYNQGLATPSVTPATITPTSIPLSLTNFTTGGVTYVYWHSATELKSVLKDSPYTQVDQTAQVTVAVTPGNGGGGIIWKNSYVYAVSNIAVFANSIPVAIASEMNLAKTGVGTFAFSWNFTSEMTPMTVGADGNLYIGIGNILRVMTSVAANPGNSNSGTFNIDTDFTIRDIINNGRYLVILGDNNNPKVADLKVGSYRCRVYFWDMIKATADIIYDIADSYLIAGKQLDGNIYFFGYNGLYVCNEVTSPLMVRPFVVYNGNSQAKPSNPYQLVKSKGSIYWIDGSNTSAYNGKIFAYGNPTSGLQKIFYLPHINGNFSNLQTVLQVVGDQYWTANAEPIIYVQNIGSTVGIGTITTINRTMMQPYRYDYTKVILSAPLGSGQTVALEVLGANASKTISVLDTKSYNSANPKQTLIFKPNPATNSQLRFEDIQIGRLILTGCSAQRVSIYATPLEDGTEDL